MQKSIQELERFETFESRQGSFQKIQLIKQMREALKSLIQQLYQIRNSVKSIIIRLRRNTSSRH